MSHSDSDDDDNEFDRTTDADGEADDDVDEDILDALEGDLAAAAEEASDADEDSDTDDSDGGSDEDDMDVEGPPLIPLPVEDSGVSAAGQVPLAILQSKPSSPSVDHRSETPPTPPPTDPASRPLSPARARIEALIANLRIPRSYTVEAICAIPQPVPTHSLAASACMTHLLTGSDDGYIRDYDIFSAVNGKLFLTAPQRHHCGVMEGLMKAAQIRYWWENPVDRRTVGDSAEESPLCAPYSLIAHSDALWALAGSDRGHINLFTVRHDPGRLCHVMSGHKGPVSALAMEHDQKGFFSAGWDGEAYLWDLNTGTVARNFRCHGSQLTALAVRPFANFHPWDGPPIDLALTSEHPPNTETLPPSATDTQQPSHQAYIPPDLQPSAEHLKQTTPIAEQGIDNSGPGPQNDDAKSDTSFDPLFDDEPDADGEADQDGLLTSANQTNKPVKDSGTSHLSLGAQQRTALAAIAPKNAPPVLDSLSYSVYSSDVLMIASIDGQIVLWDKRISTPGQGVGRLWMSDKTPPWCVSACWSADGGQIYAGRRNGTIDVYDVRQFGMATMGTPRILKTLRNPSSSGVVSCVVAFPDTRHIACASSDNIRLWNVAEANEPDSFGKMKSGVQFKIIPGHHGGFISQMLVDKAARFLVSASSNRGWFGESTRTVFVHEVKHIH